MGDALCMVMVPPTSHESHGQESNVGTPNTTTTATTGSSFRRSLNLSHGAFGLRRFSRSISHEPSETPVTENNSRRRSTISTMTAQANNTLHVRIVPSIENPSRSLIFDIFERELQPAVYIKIGRFTDRSQSPTHMSFKSKVVSRSHCEIWMEDGKLFVRDTKSSSGTFVNHIRISPPNQESRPYEIKDGDIVQLGVDYQGGVEEIYRSVKMRFEVNRTRRQRPLSFNMTAFQNIRNLTGVGGSLIQEQTASEPLSTTNNSSSPLSSTSCSSSVPVSPPVDVPVTMTQSRLNLDTCSEQEQQQKQQQLITNEPLCTTTDQPTTDSNYEACQGMDQVEECCICLYALAPYQALFVSPCAHTYHYKCIRPLLQSYPGFQCPICRTYSDLDANINMESHEVIEKYGLRRQSTIIDPTATMSCVTTTNDTQQQSEQNISQQLPTITDQQISNTSASSAPQPINESYNVDDDMAPLANLTTMDYQNLSTNHHLSPRDRQTVIIENSTDETFQHTTTSDTNDQQLSRQNTRCVTTSNQHDDNAMEGPDTTQSQDPHRRRSVILDDNVMVIPDMDMATNVTTNEQNVSQPLSSTSSPPSTEPTSHHHQQQQQQQQQQRQRRANASGFVEKLKMAFFEKRKSSIIVAPRERKRTNRPRPLSYPNFLRPSHIDDSHTDDDDSDDDDDDVLQRSDISNASSSSPASPTITHLLQQHQQHQQHQHQQQQQQQQQNNSTSMASTANHSLSRQSTAHLAEIEEEDEVPWHQHFNQYQPMSVDG